MRGSIGVVMFFDVRVFFVIDMLRVIDVLVLVNEMLIATVRVVKGFGLGKFGMSSVVAMLGGVAQRLARQHFSVHRYGNRRGCGSMRLGVPMPVIVIFKIFENVADVQEGIAVEPDVHESGLHARKHPRNAALVDTTDQRELFFALDVNFD